MVWSDNMKWEFVKKVFGNKIARELLKTKYLRSIPHKTDSNGEIDYDIHDLIIAYKELTGRL